MAKVRNELSKGTSVGIELEVFESLLGSLQYVACVIPHTRAQLRTLYRFRNGYQNRTRAIRHYRENELRCLRGWEKLLNDPKPVSSSFAARPEELEGFYVSDASNKGLGVYVKLEFLAPMTASFSLDDKWKDKDGAYIGNAEAWAVEALLEVVIKMGASNHAVTLWCNNSNVVDAWAKGWSVNALLNDSITRMSQLVFLYNIRLYIEHIGTADNPADAVSRIPPFDKHTFPEGLAPSPPPGSRLGPDPRTTTNPLIEAAELRDST